MKRVIGIGIFLIFLFVVGSCGVPQKDVNKVTLSGSYATEVTSTGVEFNVAVTPMDEDGDMITSYVTGDNFSFDNIEVYQISDPTDEGEFYTTADVRVKGITINEVSSSSRMVGAILIDSSGSMSDSDPDKERVKAAKRFIETMKSNDLLCIYDFGAAESDVRLLQDFTSDKKALDSAVDMVEDVGSTPLYKAIVTAAEHIEAFKEKYGKSDDRYFIIVLTDGASTDEEYSIDDAIAAANSVPLPIFTIGLGDDVDIDSLSKLAYSTGGNYIQASQPQELIQFFQAQAVANTKGYIVVKGNGEFSDPLEDGKLYKMTGDLVTSIGGNNIRTPFSVIFSY